MGKILFLITLVVTLIIVMPFIFIWVLNTLFPVVAIPITFKTWLAAALFGLVVGGRFK